MENTKFSKSDCVQKCSGSLFGSCDPQDVKDLKFLELLDFLGANMYTFDAKTINKKFQGFTYQSFILVEFIHIFRI